MKAIALEASRGAAVGLLVGLLVGFIAALIAAVGFHFGWALVLCLGVAGAAISVLMILFRQAVQLGGLQRILSRALSGAVLGITLVPILYIWGWCTSLIWYTIGVVVILTVCAALNEALDIMAEHDSPKPQEAK